MVEGIRARRSRVAESENALLPGLPDTETRHWFPRHKAAVVAAVNTGILSLPEACHRGGVLFLDRSD